MSDVNVNKEFSEFGSKFYTIAILTVISFILGIISWIIAVVSIIQIIFYVVIFIIFITALGNLKSVAYALNNQNIHEFRSKIILSFIFFFIGSFFFWLPLIFLFSLGDPGVIWAYIIIMLFLVIGIIFLIVAAIIRLLAWSQLEKFFANNVSLFPQNIGNDAKTGANLCKIGAILDITIILGVIGEILRMVGYFKLASLRNSNGA